MKLSTRGDHSRLSSVPASVRGEDDKVSAANSPPHPAEKRSPHEEIQKNDSKANVQPQEGKASSALTISSESLPDTKDVEQSAKYSLTALVDPERKKRQAASKASWKTYLKCSSEYNRAEMKFLALQSDLQVAEFWLELMTKNLDDVGKRMEAHEWNYTKAVEQGELEC